MFSQLILAFALAAFSLAYQVTSPNDSKGWTTFGSQLATWKRVKSTDPMNFTAVLTNVDRSVMAENNQILATFVDGTSEHVQLDQPKDGWPQGKGFRLNFCRDGQSPEAILAQSNEFEIAPEGAVGVESLNGKPQSLDAPPTAKSNGAMARKAFEATKDGLMGLVGFLALMFV